MLREYVHALTAASPGDGQLTSFVMPRVDTETTGKDVSALLFRVGNRPKGLIGNRRPMLNINPLSCAAQKFFAHQSMKVFASSIAGTLPSLLWPPGEPDPWSSLDKEAVKPIGDTVP